MLKTILSCDNEKSTCGKQLSHAACQALLNIDNARKQCDLFFRNKFLTRATMQTICWTDFILGVN